MTVDIFKSRFKRCRHTHLSGRRCSSMVPKSNKAGLCVAHVAGPCSECANMRQSFVPPKGW